MKDPNCLAPGCPFSDGARGGACTGTPGVLSAAEIVKIIRDGATVTFDAAAAAEIVTWAGTQWVSWDSVKTLKLKVDYANQRCLGGYVFTMFSQCNAKLTSSLSLLQSTMVWAIDLDDGTLINSLGANMGRPKSFVSPEAPPMGSDLGTGWPDEL
jgi:chitinase